MRLFPALVGLKALVGFDVSADSLAMMQPMDNVDLSLGANIHRVHRKFIRFFCICCASIVFCNLCIDWKASISAPSSFTNRSYFCHVICRGCC